MSDRFRIHKVNLVDAQKREYQTCLIVEDLEAKKFLSGRSWFNGSFNEDIIRNAIIRISEKLIEKKENYANGWVDSFDKAIEEAFAFR